MKRYVIAKSARHDENAFFLVDTERCEAVFSWWDPLSSRFRNDGLDLIDYRNRTPNGVKLDRCTIFEELDSIAEFERWFSVEYFEELL